MNGSSRLGGPPARLPPPVPAKNAGPKSPPGSVAEINQASHSPESGNEGHVPPPPADQAEAEREAHDMKTQVALHYQNVRQDGQLEGNQLDAGPGFKPEPPKRPAPKRPGQVADAVQVPVSVAVPGLPDLKARAGVPPQGVVKPAGVHQGNVKRPQSLPLAVQGFKWEGFETNNAFIRPTPDSTIEFGFNIQLQGKDTNVMPVTRTVERENVPQFRKVVADWLKVSRDLSKEGLLGIFSAKSLDPGTAAKYNLSTLDTLLRTNNVPFVESDASL